MQSDTARRIAIMDRASPEVVSEIEKEFEKRLASLVSDDFTTVGGIDLIVDIINQVDRGTEKNIMENLEIEDPELAEVIKKRMFVFEDIITLDNKSIQRVLREVDNHQLAIALKGAGESVKEVIMNNISQRLATMIQEDLEYMGPKRMKEIEDAQQKIVNIIRRLEDAGEIVLSRGAGDEVIV
jgi:flagellar motor switch protein FliG